MSERDPDLQALFAAADEPLAAPAFTQDVMAELARRERLRLWRRAGLGGVFALILWALSLEALPFTLSQSFVDLSSFGIGDHWVAEALLPVNSLAGVLTLVLLGLRALYRRIFG